MAFRSYAVVTAVVLALVLRASPAMAEDEGIPAPFTMNAVMHEYQEQGITPTPQGIADIKWFEQYSQQVRRAHQELDQYYEGYLQQGNEAMAKKIRHQKEQLKLIWRHTPKYRPSVSFLRELIEYKSGKEFKKSNGWLRQIRQDMGTYQKDVGYLTGAGEAGTGTGGPGSGGGPGKVSGSLEVYVASVSGDVEFYINDQKVERSRQTFPLSGVGFLTLRAVGVGERRKQSRTFAAPANTVALHQDDYRLHYQTQMGKEFRGETDWQVETERYAWTVSRAPNGHVQYEHKSSGKHPGLEGDLTTFKFDGVFSFGATVKAEAEWKAVSTRPGGSRQMQHQDTASGAIELSVSPRGE